MRIPNHHNLFSPFEKHAPRLKENGYRVRELTRPFDREALVDVQITLIIAPLASRNALRSDRRPTDAEVAAAWHRPTPSAFTEDEVSVLRRWVREGGALLIASDHFPLPGAVAELGAAFGIEISNGFAVDGTLLTELTSQKVSQAGRVVFERTEGGSRRRPDNQWPYS